MNVDSRKNRFLQQEAANPANSAWVEASAGTGKTKVLTDRILRLLLSGTPTANILCLTFTKSATMEMEERLKERLLSWSTMPDDQLIKDLKNLTNEWVNSKHCSKARELYDEILQADGQPKFHTIHSFCESLLRRYPDEAGIDGSFTVLDEQDSFAFLQSAKDHVLKNIQIGSNTSLKEAIRYVSTYTHSEGFSDLLGFLISRKSRLEDLFHSNNSEKLSKSLRKKLHLPTEISEIDVLDRACQSASMNTKGLHSSIKQLQKGTKTDKKKAGIIHEWLSVPQHQRPREFDKYCSAFITRDHQPAKRLVSNAVASDHPDVRIILQEEQKRLIKIRTILQRIKIFECTKSLLELTNQVTRRLEHAKMFHNCLDYDDLIIKARKALHSYGASSWMLYRLDNSIDHILVDEAQDTSSEQWEIIKTLVSEFFSGASSRAQHRTIFVVGDYKQSIYSFQQAEPDAFREMHQYFRDRATTVSAPWSDINLQLSFRSTLPILQAVDLVFPPDSIMYTEFYQESGRATNHYCHRSKAPGLVELWPVIKPREKRPESTLQLPVRLSGQQSSRAQLANHVAAKIADLLSGKGNPEGTNLQPGDILVLVRRRSEFVTDLLKELQIRRIPVAGMDRLILTDNIAVMDLVSLGNFLLNTDDDLSLAEVLKSPLCNFDDNDLFDIAYNRNESLWASLCGSSSSKTCFKNAKHLLKTLLKKMLISTPYELFADLLVAQGAAKLFVSRLGQDAVEPLEEFLNQAIQYESHHSPSLQHFINWVENSRLTVRRDPAQANERTVRILTVHGAKGLEAPVVFLPDTVQKSHRSLNIFWPRSEAHPLWIPSAGFVDELTERLSSLKKKKDQEEYQRLLYVAMTRARDQLYICGWSENANIPSDCWYNMASKGLRGKAKEISEPFLDQTQPHETVNILRMANFSPAQVRQTTLPTSPGHPRKLPPWATQKLGLEDIDSLPTSLSTINYFSASHITETRSEKLIAHLVNFLIDVASIDRNAAADYFVADISQEISSGPRKTIKQSALKICDSPALSFLFEAGSRGCLPVSGKVKNGSQTSLVYSSIDRLILKDDVVTVVNFHTESRDLRNSRKIPGSILEEIAINATLARALYPNKRIASVILWTATQSLESISQEVLGKSLS